MIAHAFLAVAAAAAQLCLGASVRRQGSARFAGPELTACEAG